MSQKRILMVISPVDFRDEEFLEPYDYFTKILQDWVTVASPQVGTATGMLGATYEVTETLIGKSASDYDALVIVGGSGSPAYLWENAELRQLIQDFNTQQKVLSAICLSGVALAKAGVLTGRNATVWDMPESLAAYAEARVNYLTEDVVTDGHIVTANGPQAASDFAKAIGKLLSAVATH